MEGLVHMQSTTQRPTGITILAVLAAIAGVFGLLNAFTILGGNSISGILGLVIALAYLAFAYGAWSLQPWAWMIGVAVAGLGVLLQILNLFTVPGYNIFYVILGVLIPGAILYYLMTPEIKKAFGQPA